MRKFFVLSVVLLLSLDVLDVEAGNRRKSKFVHPWYATKVAYLGDSITDANVLKEDTHYWGFLKEWLDIEPLVYGKSGHQWHQIAGQADKLMEEHGDGFDAIMIFVGTNDYNAGVYVYGNADHIEKKSLFAAGKKAVVFPQGTGKCRAVCGGRHQAAAGSGAVF